MRRYGMLAILIGLSILLAQQVSGWPRRDEAPSEPDSGLPHSQQIYAIFTKSMKADAQALTNLQSASSDEARRRALQARQDAYQRDANRLLEIADAAPDEPTVVDALVWLVEKLPDAPEGAEAADRLINGYITSPRLVGVSTRIAKTGSDLAVGLLGEIAAKNPLLSIRCEAECDLAILLKTRAERAEWSDADKARELAREAEAGFERALSLNNRRQEAPVETAERIRSELEELRDLGPGQPAPKLEGLDVDGKPMRLEDYRGKVVALTFWGDWCSLCWHFYPHQRALVERMSGRPFALVGVNSDSTDVAQLARAQGKVTWPSWADGGQVRGGPIAHAWNVRALPVTFLIDDRGIIRYKVTSHVDDHDTTYFLDPDGTLKERWQARAAELSRAAEALVLEAEAHTANPSS